MRYATGRMMKVGDKVVADGMPGIIVCDFDNCEFSDNYQHLNAHPGVLADRAIPSTGVMIKTVEAGLIHYGEGTWGIEPIDDDRV